MSPPSAPEAVLTHEAPAGGAQLMQQVVNVNVPQNGDEVIVEEVLNNSVVEVEVVMEVYNPIQIDLTEAEDEVMVVSSSPLSAPSPPPMQCPVGRLKMSLFFLLFLQQNCWRLVTLM